LKRALVGTASGVLPVLARNATAHWRGGFGRRLSADRQGHGSRRA